MFSSVCSILLRCPNTIVYETVAKGAHLYVFSVSKLV